MAITQAVCTSFKKELAEGRHHIKSGVGDTIKIALYTNEATLNADTTLYSIDNEIPTTVDTGYVGGGKVLTVLDAGYDKDVYLIDFDDVTWGGAKFTCRGALIYNDTAAGRVIAVLDFKKDQTVTDGTFTIKFPAATVKDSILRIK